MPDIAQFFKEIFSSPFMFMAVFSSLLLMLVNGWTDAPVSIASPVTSGAITFRKAAVLSAVCNFLGAVAVCSLGNSVAVSITELSDLKSVEPRLASAAFTAALTAVAAWSLLALVFGLPTSESHALISALFGSSLAVLDKNAVSLVPILKVLTGLVISTLPVAFLSKRIAKLLKHRFKNQNQKFKNMQILGASMSAFAHGAQDGQKFAGVFAVQTALVMGNGDKVTVPLYAVALSALLISCGMLLGGKKIVESLSRFSPTKPINGFAADVTSSVALIIMSLLGIPASTTSTKTSAVIGAGGKDLRAAMGIFLAWVLTFPACMLLGYLGTVVLKAFV